MLNTIDQPIGCIFCQAFVHVINTTFIFVIQYKRRFHFWTFGGVMVCGKDHSTLIFLRHVGTHGYIIIETKYGGFHFTFFWNGILWETNFFTVPSIDKLLSIIKLLSKL